MSIVDGSNELAIISATTLLGPNKGSLAASVVTANGIPRGRTNVSCATASGGNYLHSVLCQRLVATAVAVNHIPHWDRPKGSGLYRECQRNLRVQVHCWPHALWTENDSCRRRHGLRVAVLECREHTIIRRRPLFGFEKAKNHSRNHWYGPERAIVH
jgi:hypothetical protein